MQELLRLSRSGHQCHGISGQTHLVGGGHVFIMGCLSLLLSTSGGRPVTHERPNHVSTLCDAWRGGRVAGLKPLVWLPGFLHQVGKRHTKVIRRGRRLDGRKPRRDEGRDVNLLRCAATESVRAFSIPAISSSTRPMYRILTTCGETSGC